MIPRRVPFREGTRLRSVITGNFQKSRARSFLSQLSLTPPTRFQFYLSKQVFIWTSHATCGKSWGQIVGRNQPSHIHPYSQTNHALYLTGTTASPTDLPAFAKLPSTYQPNEPNRPSHTTRDQPRPSPNRHPGPCIRPIHALLNTPHIHQFQLKIALWAHPSQHRRSAQIHHPHATTDTPRCSAPTRYPCIAIHSCSKRKTSPKNTPHSPTLPTAL